MIFLSGPVLCPSEVKGDKIGLYWLNVVSSHSYIGGATAPPDLVLAFLYFILLKKLVESGLELSCKQGCILWVTKIAPGYYLFTIYIPTCHWEPTPISPQEGNGC